MVDGNKRIFTGLQPSGILHIGNYFGALKPVKELFESNEGLLMVADYHSLTTLKDAAQRRENIISIVKDYLAAGVNLDNAILFKQSDITEHTELAWIFETLVTVPFLELAHAYKDKVAKGLEANAGLFNYPMLMAADILLYDTDIVPVGQDQKQHVEYAREAAAKFNNAYGQTFKEPQEQIQTEVAIVPGTDGQKMSKSYGNTIPLFGTKEDITKAVMSIVTDSNPTIVPGKDGHSLGPANLWSLHRLFKSTEELEPLYVANQKNYKALKEDLIETIERFAAPMRAKRDSITDEEVKKVLAEGAAKAKAIAQAKMEDVRKKVGVTI